MGEALRSFLELNEAMALRALLDQALLVEKQWDEDAERALALSRLMEMLDWALLHRSPLVRKIGSLNQRLPSDPSYHQFMSLFVPIEREHGRLVTDADFLARAGDRAESHRPQSIPGILILDNLRSAFNVGSILRTAECMALEKVYLCGYTPRPDQEKVGKAALGTERYLAWEWRPHAQDLLREMRAEGLAIFALETAARARPLEDFIFPSRKLALLVGNERHGIESDRLQLCDGTLEIPCWGRKNSLNVAVSLGMAVFEWRRQWLKSGFIEKASEHQ